MLDMAFLPLTGLVLISKIALFVARIRFLKSIFSFAPFIVKEESEIKNLGASFSIRGDLVAHPRQDRKGYQNPFTNLNFPEGLFGSKSSQKKNESKGDLRNDHTLKRPF